MEEEERNARGAGRDAYTPRDTAGVMKRPDAVKGECVLPLRVIVWEKYFILVITKRSEAVGEKKNAFDEARSARHSREAVVARFAPRGHNVWRDGVAPPRP